jgi:hypothetical protein
MTEPASIRYNNPGAMWGGNAISKKWGEMGNIALNDGMGQNNHIAVFPTYVQGICAQIDLWRSPRYHNKRFADAIKIWSGGNWVQSYIDFVKARVPGMTEDTIMSDAMLNSSMGIAFLKAQAWHEAGKPYPAPDADWIKAQSMVFSGRPPIVILPTKPHPLPPDVPPIDRPSTNVGSFWAIIPVMLIAAGGAIYFFGKDKIIPALTRAKDWIVSLFKRK